MCKSANALPKVVGFLRGLRFPSTRKFDRVDVEKVISQLQFNKSHIISTDEDPVLRIESFAVINLRGVSTNKNIIISQLLYIKIKQSWLYVIR
jgi:hypothetical protein